MRKGVQVSAQPRRRKINKKYFLLGGCLLLVFLLVFSSVKTNHLKSFPRRDRAGHLAGPALIKALALGFHLAAADLIWVRALLALEKGLAPEDGDWLYQTLTLIIQLDPEFYPAYLYGGISLSAAVSRTGLSTLLLLKGAEKFPSDWQIPFLIGSNYYRLNDYPNTIKWMRASSERPGLPPWFPSFPPETEPAEEIPGLAGDDFSAQIEKALAAWEQTRWGLESRRLALKTTSESSPAARN